MMPNNLHILMIEADSVVIKFSKEDKCLSIENDVEKVTFPMQYHNVVELGSKLDNLIHCGGRLFHSFFDGYKNCELHLWLDSGSYWIQAIQMDICTSQMVYGLLEKEELIALFNHMTSKR